MKLSRQNVLWALARLGGEALVEDVAEKGGWSRPRTVHRLKSAARDGMVKRKKNGKWKILGPGIDRIS